MSNSIPPKHCPRCDRDLPADSKHFRKDNRLNVYPDGFRKYCVECDKKRPTLTLPPYPGHVDIPEGTPARTCTRCGEPFPETKQYYHTYSNRQPDRLRTQCKWCLQPDKNKRPPEAVKIVDTSKKYCAGCDSTLPATEEYFYPRNRRGKCDWQSRCKECQCTTRTAYYHEHVDERRAYWNAQHRQYIRENYERWIQWNRDWYAANREHINERVRNNPNTIPNAIRYNHRRRTLKLQVGGHYTQQDVEDQLKRQKYRCYWCKRRLEKKKNGKYVYHVDHYTPLTREGSSNYPWNLVMACGFCNQSRGNKLPHEWRVAGRLF